MTDITWDGAVAVVTGGAGGIGRALVARLVAAGARVVVVDLDAGVAEAAATELGAALGIGVDVGDEAGVTAMIGRVGREVGPVDLYFSNAGVATEAGLGSDAAWDVGWRVHGLAHIYAARALVPEMVARGSGAFVVTASAAGLLMTMQSAPYTVTKHASVAITEWLAVNYGGSGVQFHCLCPQGVRTPMLAEGFGGDQGEVAASGPIMDPVDVADAVLQAIRDDRFLILPHPEVHGYEQRKVEDRDRWLGGMRRLLARFQG